MIHTPIRFFHDRRAPYPHHEWCKQCRRVRAWDPIEGGWQCRFCRRQIEAMPEAVHTSNFATYGRANGAQAGGISIALYAPKWWSLAPAEPDLYPPPELLHRAKRDLVDGPGGTVEARRINVWAWYAPEYRARVLAPLDPVALFRRLQFAATGHPPVLLCWCGDRGATCHRSLVAEWLRGAGVKAGEWP